MNVLIKISAVVIVFICFSLILKSNRPEYVFLMRIFAVILIFSLMLDDIATFISDILSAFSVFSIESSHLKLLLKVSGVAVLTDFICDTLKENGDLSLAGVISVSAKFVILYMSLPMINALIIFCVKLIE